MFGKKVLKVISALFVGTQLISLANAADLTSCNNVDNMSDVCADATTTSKNCIDSDGKIYEIETGTSCAIRGTQYTTAGIVVFEDDGTNVGGSAKTDNSGTLSNYAAYRCTGTGANTTCERTYGYVKLGSYVCTIGKVEDPACVAASSITTGCDLASIGSLCLNTDIKLKLTDTPDLTKKIDDTGAAVNYMMKNVASNIFTNAADNGSADTPVNKNIIIEASENAIVLLSNSYDYCENTGGVVVPTFEDFCTQNDDSHCQNIQECTNGLCKRAGGDDALTCESIVATTSGANSGCTDGYYIATNESGGALKTNGTAGTLFSCTTGTCTVVDAEFKVGYYKFAGQTNKYIVCSTKNACTSVAVKTDKANCGVADVAVGDVINNGTNNILCLDTTEKGGVILDNVTTYNGDYFMNGIAENVVNTKPSEFVIVSVAGETVQLKDKVSDSIPKYKYTSDVSKIYGRQSNDVCDPAKVIVEYKHKEDDSTHNYYEKHVTHTN